MRSIPRLGLILTAVLLLLSGCGGGSSPSPPVQPPSELSYTDGTAVYIKGTAITANIPTSTGGAVATYSASPALPAGLTLNPIAGVITGTPTAVTATANYTITGSNSAGSTTAILTITVNVPPLSADNINLIFVVSEDLAYQASGDVNPITANLTNQGLQRSLLMAPFLQQIVLGGQNVTGIYALEPMTHPQTTSNYPDMVALETIQQFAMLNQIALPNATDGLTQTTASSFPLNVSYAITFVPTSEIAAPLLFCYACPGLDFNDLDGDNESVLKGIIADGAPGFYVLSAPWEITSSMLAKINLDEGYQLSLPASYQGPNYIYAISIAPSAPSGSASLVTFNTNVNPPSTYPVLPSPGLVTTPCYAQTPFSIPTSGSIPPPSPSAGFNTNETVYFMRHAEAHPTATWEDGNYVAAGQWRALDLPNALQGKISPTQVYSIDPAQVAPSGHSYFSYVRPSLTVEPYAIANNLPMNLIADFGLLAPNASQLTSDFLFNCCALSGQSVLVAWEHDHIPTTVNALLKSYGSTLTAPAWPSDDYDTIWTVTLDAGGNLTVNNATCEGINSAQLPATAPQF